MMNTTRKRLFSALSQWAMICENFREFVDVTPLHRLFPKNLGTPGLWSLVFVSTLQCHALRRVLNITSLSSEICRHCLIAAEDIDLRQAGRSREMSARAELNTNLGGYPGNDQCSGKFGAIHMASSSRWNFFLNFSRIVLGQFWISPLSKNISLVSSKKRRTSKKPYTPSEWEQYWVGKSTSHLPSASDQNDSQ